jgi:predicted metalloprotease with PDZ domain
MKTATSGFVVFCSLLFLAGCKNILPEKKGYSYRIDLTTITDDKLAVELLFSGNLADTSHFFLPKIVPGIYDELNFGKYLIDFQAFDKKGKSLNVKKSDENSWRIIGSKNLKSICYNINDGWEKFDFQDLRPYRSSESHFDSSVIVLNPGSVFGYFGNNKDLPFQINIKKPAGFYAATSLQNTKSSEYNDLFTTENYRLLADNPLLYSLPDTASIRLPHISVKIACYSTSGAKIAGELSKYIAPLVKNQTEYIGGKLPANNYTFIIYHDENQTNKSYFADGLEHSHSTLILIHSPLDMEILKDNIFNIASHEFFHILMPLGIHSHEIAEFDFNHPRFSKHLWLYEGMTEYFTIHMPVKQGLKNSDDFIQIVQSKYAKMNGFANTVPITQLSLNVINMPEEYMNVYSKGALINLCLDIHLRKLSKGKYGVQELVRELMNRYGKDRAFEDDKLFDEITEITGFPETADFIRKYISGNEPVPLKESLQLAGFELDAKTGKISSATLVSEEQLQLRKWWINQ